MNDPGLDYEKLIAQENRFYMTFFFALAGGASTLYLSFQELFDRQASLALLGGTLSFLMIIALIWWKKVEALVDKKRAHLDFLKKTNPELRDFYAHQEDFLEEDRKNVKSIILFCPLLSTIWPKQRY